MKFSQQDLYRIISDLSALHDRGVAGGSPALSEAAAALCDAASEIHRLNIEATALRKAIEGPILDELEAMECPGVPDDYSVGWTGDDRPLAVTFGHIRRLRLALSRAPTDGSH